MRISPALAQSWPLEVEFHTVKLISFIRMVMVTKNLDGTDASQA
jgi:hypothetical protein